jgi:hypothetical protein
VALSGVDAMTEYDIQQLADGTLFVIAVIIFLLVVL